MVSENLKDWIKQKREEGVSDERIKKSLEKTGHDPSVIDELENPFDNDSSDVGPSEDVFNSSGESSETEKPDQNDSEIDKSQVEKSIEDSKSKNSENTGFSKPGLPSVNPSRKQLVIPIVLVLLLAGGFAIYSYAPFDSLSNINVNTVLGNGVDSSSDMTKLETLEKKYAGCPDSGVRVEAVSSSEGVTTADILVTRNKAWVVLEVKKNGEVIGFSTDETVGNSQITVNAVGDQVELRPLGCADRYSRKSY